MTKKGSSEHSLLSILLAALFNHTESSLNSSKFLLYRGIKFSQVASLAIIASKFDKKVPIAFEFILYTFFLLCSLLVSGLPSSSFFKIISSFFARDTVSISNFSDTSSYLLNNISMLTSSSPFLYLS